MKSGDDVAFSWNIKQNSSDAAPDQIDADNEQLEKKTTNKMGGSSVRNLK